MLRSLKEGGGQTTYQLVEYENGSMQQYCNFMGDDLKISYDFKTKQDCKDTIKKYETS